MNGGYPLPIPVDLAYVIYFNGVCAHCGARVGRDLRRCSCGKPRKVGCHLDVAFNSMADRAALWKVLIREQRRVILVRRKQQTKENGGTHTRKQIAELYRSQKGACHYCSCKLSKKKDSGSYPHVDHYVSIIEGGSDDISNLVIACQRCNRAKGWRNGADFSPPRRTSRAAARSRRR